LGIYSGGGSINNVIPMPFGVNGGGSNIENALLTMA
jgi:hypothetical protein